MSCNWIALSGAMTGLALILSTASVGAQTASSQAPENATAAQSHANRDAAATTKTAIQLSAEALQQARQTVRANPTDAKAHYALGEALRKCGRKKEAGEEYLQATSLDPTMLLAYHQIANTCDDQDQLDEAISRLNKLKEDQPRDLLVRVALSEIYEKCKNYQLAARALIDLMYSNGIPAKYSTRISGRIHYLLLKAKEATGEEAQVQTSQADDEPDVVPSPLPDTGLRKALTASKIKEPKDMKGVGHVPLLP